MNIYKLVVEAYQLSNEQAKELFKCDETTLVKILDGIEKPSLDGIYNLSKKYDISLDLIMDLESTSKKDQQVLDGLLSRIEKNQRIKAEDEFYNDLIKHRIGCVSRDKLDDVYDSKSNTINIVGVIVKDNYNLYKYVKSKGLGVLPGGYKLNPLRQNDKDNIIDTWDKADNAVFTLFKSGVLKDKGFNNVVLDLSISNLSIEEANEILKKYQDGTLKFDPRHVLILINNGAYIKKFAGTTINSVGFTEDHWEKDVFATLMLKKYCEDIL